MDLSRGSIGAGKGYKAGRAYSKPGPVMFLVKIEIGYDKEAVLEGGGLCMVVFPLISFFLSFFSPLLPGSTARATGVCGRF